MFLSKKKNYLVPDNYLTLTNCTEKSQVTIYYIKVSYVFTFPNALLKAEVKPLL